MYFMTITMRNGTINNLGLVVCSKLFEVIQIILMSCCCFIPSSSIHKFSIGLACNIIMVLFYAKLCYALILQT